MGRSTFDVQMLLFILGAMGAASLLGEETEQIIAGGVVAAVACLAMVALVWLDKRNGRGE